MRCSEALRSGLEKIDRFVATGNLPFPTASANLVHWRDGSGQNRTLPGPVFQSNPFLLDHLRENHRPKLIAATKRRLISGELAPGRASVDIDYADTASAPIFTDLFFALGELAVHSKVRVAVMSSGRELSVRFDPWQTEIAGAYEWDPFRWALIPGIARVTGEEMLALQRSGYGRGYRVRSDWVTITDPGVIAAAVLPAGNY